MLYYDCMDCADYGYVTSHVEYCPSCGSHDVMTRALTLEEATELIEDLSEGDYDD